MARVAIPHRRSAPESGARVIGNRQRFLRRAKAAGQRGREEIVAVDRDIKDILEGGEVSVPIDGMDEPRFAARAAPRHGAARQQGVHRRRQASAAARRAAARQRGSRGRQRRRVPLRSQPRRVRRPVPGRPGTARSRQAKLAEVESRIRRAGYTASGSPANLTVSRTMRNSLARRIALRRPRPEMMAASRRRWPLPARRRAAPNCMAEIEALKAKINASRSSIRSTSATGVSRRCRSRWRRLSCSA